MVERIQHLLAGSYFDPFHLSIPYGTTIEQRAAPGEKLRKLGERRLSLAKARAIRPPLFWLGAEHFNRPLSSIEEVRWNAGVAYRLRYGNITLWDYRTIVPPALLASRLGAPAKPLPIRGNVVHFYMTTGGDAVAELDRHGWSIALVAPTVTKEDVVAGLRSLRELR